MKKIISEHGKYIIFSQGEKQGLLKKRFLRTPEEIIPPITKIEPAFMFGKRIFKIYNGERCGLYDARKQCPVLSVVFKTVEYAANNRAIVFDNMNKYRVFGLYDKEKISSSDYICHVWYKGPAFNVKRNLKYGILDEDGNQQLPFEYDYLEVCLFKYLLYKKDSEFVVYDFINGKEICGSSEEILFKDYQFYDNKGYVLYVDYEAKRAQEFTEAYLEGFAKGSMNYPW